MRKFTLLLAAACFLTAAASAALHAAPKEESVSFYGTYRNDGGCATIIPSMGAEYDLSNGPLAVHADVNVTPSASDCEKPISTYNFSVLRDFKLAEKFSAMAKFRAFKQPAMAFYTLPDGTYGSIGGVPLPGAIARSEEAVLGVTTHFPFGDVSVGFNMVQVPWAMHDNGRAVNVMYSKAFDALGGELDFHSNTNLGFVGEQYGNIRATYTREVIRLKFKAAYGLDAFASPAAPTYDYLGVEHVLFNPVPRSWSVEIGIGFRFGL